MIDENGSGFGYELVQSKIEIPAAQKQAVQRWRLIQRLDEGLSRQLITVTAPSGYGKTTLLSQWAKESLNQQISFAWISLDEYDNSQLRFWSNLASSIHRVYPTFNLRANQFVPSGEANQDPVYLNRLINTIAAIPGRLCIILDDFQWITNPAVHRGIEYIIRHPAENCVLTISSRTTLPISISRLRTQERVLEISTGDLSFNQEEARLYLTGMLGNPMDYGLAKQMWENSAGWVTGLKIAAYTIQKRNDYSPIKTTGLEYSPQIISYLSEEVLNAQEPRLREFLIKTSILSEIYPPLCDALLGRTDSGEIIDCIERENLFITALDWEHKSFRFHPLFKKAMGVILERTWPAEIPELHRRAIAWYCSSGRPERAVAHAVSLGDVDLAVEILESWSTQAIHNLDWKALVEWISCLPEGYYLKHPNLGVNYAIATHMLYQTRTVETTLDTIEHGLCSGEESCPDLPIYLWKISALRTIRQAIFLPFEETINRFQQLIEDAPGRDAFIEGLIYHCMGEAAERAARLDLAAEAYEKAFKVNDFYQLKRHSSLNLCALARIRKLQGRLKEAQDVYRQAIHYCTLNRLGPGRNVLAQTGLVEIDLENYFTNVDPKFIQKLVNSLPEVEADNLPDHYYALLLIRLAKYYLFSSDTEKARDFLMMARRLDAYDWFPVPLPEFFYLQTSLGINTQEDRLISSMSGEADPLLKTSAIRILAEGIAQTRSAVLKGDLDDIFPLVNQLYQPVEECGYQDWRIIVRLFAALAAENKGDISRMQREVGSAVGLAAPEGMVGVFVEQGIMIRDLLRRCQSQSGLMPPSDTISDWAVFSAYICRILDAFSADRSAILNRETLLVQNSEFVGEELSIRELEVIRLLVRGASVKEVAEELCISTNTVKAHIKRIYHKLGIHKRSNLSQKAQEINFSVILQRQISSSSDKP